MNVGDLITTVLGCSFLLYGSVTILLLIGLKKVRPRNAQQKPFVSVIVAARNEADNIPRLLDSLLTQSYTPYEIIIVDDDSSDQTLAIANDYASRHSRLTVVSAKSKNRTSARKKAALTDGIRASKGELLCFTDADCLPGNDWLVCLVSQFTEEVGVVAGYSPYDHSLLSHDERPTGVLASLFWNFLRYEELKGAIWSAGSIGIQRGWLCTGRNLAYRRKVWDEVGGFSEIMASISGDDDLFLQLVRRSTRWTISYVFDPRSFVPTAPPATFQKFIMQRRRHFSAGKYFSIPMKLFFLAFHGSNLLLFLGVVIGFFVPNLLFAALLFFAAKIGLDIVLATAGASRLAEDRIWTRVLVMELLYLTYTTLIGPLGFVGTFEWKPNLKS